MKFRPIILTATAAVVFAACGSAGASKAPTSVTPSAAPSDTMMSHDPSMPAAPSGSAMTGDVMTDSEAADLRTKLDLALGEHIIFASKATGALLGRTPRLAATEGVIPFGRRDPELFARSGGAPRRRALGIAAESTSPIGWW